MAVNLQIPVEVAEVFTAILSFTASMASLDEKTLNSSARQQLDPFVFDLLKKKYSAVLTEFWNSAPLPKHSDKAIVIVERRCHPNLQFCLMNAAYFCRGYAVHIVCSRANLEFIRFLVGKQHDNIHYHCLFDTVGSPEEGYTGYNNLLKQKHFWERFQEEHIITLETDSYFVKPLPESIYRYDYVASRWPWMREQPGGGGLSYRKRSAMLRICDRMKDEVQPPAQDAFACEGVMKLGLSFPTEEENCFYFTEAYYSDTLCGTHQWWTYVCQNPGQHGEAILGAIFLHTTFQLVDAPRAQS